MENTESPEKRECPLTTWIAEHDSLIAAEVARLESAQPDRFSPQIDIIEHLTQISTQAGKRAILNELIEFTGLNPEKK